MRPSFVQLQDHRSWVGPDVRKGASRAEVAQTLAHAAFATQFPSLPRSPTAGRDGGIDVFIDGTGHIEILGERYPLPLVVQIKSHERGQVSWSGQLRSTWKSEVKALDTAADRGWTGDHEPWRRAKSYLYVTCSVVPKQACRDSLARNISAAFDRYAAAGGPDLEVASALDWDQWARWLDSLPGLAERWVGPVHQGLVPHPTVMERLDQSASPLSSRTLPYVPPQPEAAWHPDRLWQLTRDRAGIGGVLVSGGYGVGKTRLLCEVARRAERDGYVAYHLSPTDPPVTCAHLVELVMQAQNAPVLFLLDDVDEFPNLTESVLASQLFDQATLEGHTVALMAAAHSGASVMSGRRAFYKRVDLILESEHGRSVAKAMLEALAPSLAKRLAGRGGLADMVALCGDLPGIAAAVACAAERVFRRGDWQAESLEQEAASALDYCVETLQRTLGSDRLLTAGIVLAACPAPEAQLRGLAGRVLADSSPAADVDVVVKLVEQGWLRAGPDGLDSVTSLLAPGIIRYAIHASGTPPAAWHTLLSNLFSDEGAFLRALEAVRRVAVTCEGDRHEPCDRALAKWFDTARADFSLLLAKSSGSTAALLIQRLLDVPQFRAPFWHGEDEWISIPLIYRASDDDPRVFAPLCMMLRKADQRNFTHLLGILDWMADRSENREGVASALVEALKSDSVTGGHERRLARIVENWMRRNGQDAAAWPVYESLLPAHLLLRRSGPELRTRLIECALAWIRRYGQRPEAARVLGCLLQSVSEVGESDEVVSACWEWLESHRGRSEASFVLERLLMLPREARPGTQPPESSCAVCAATLHWLRLHGESLQARFVLAARLRGPHAGCASWRGLQQEATIWLAGHGGLPEARFVLVGLLVNTPESESIDDCATIELAFSWLRENGTAVEARNVLSTLGEVPWSPFSPDQPKHWRHFVLEWLAEHHTASCAGMVLSASLGREGWPSADLDLLFSYAIRWLSQYYDSSHAQEVAELLFRRFDW